MKDNGELPKNTDPEYLTHEQYSDAGKINLRNEIQEEHGNHPVPWFEWLFGWLEIPNQACLLELGSGSGELWMENRQRIPAGTEVVLSDLSPGMARGARDAVQSNGAVFYPTVLDAQHIPFPAETFSAALAVGLLDLIPNLDETLAEIWRVLQPSGVFLTSAGGRHHLNELESLLRPFLPEAELGGEPEHFGLENGKAILAGFFEEVLRHDYTDRMVFEEVQPLLDYVLSEAPIREALTGERLAGFVNRVKQELSRNGQIQVTRQKGVFVARKKLLILE